MIWQGKMCSWVCFFTICTNLLAGNMQNVFETLDANIKEEVRQNVFKTLDADIREKLHLDEKAQENKLNRSFLIALAWVFSNEYEAYYLDYSAPIGVLGQGEEAKNLVRNWPFKEEVSLDLLLKLCHAPTKAFTDFTFRVKKEHIWYNGYQNVNKDSLRRDIACKESSFSKILIAVKNFPKVFSKDEPTIENIIWLKQHGFIDPDRWNKIEELSKTYFQVTKKRLSFRDVKHILSPGENVNTFISFPCNISDFIKVYNSEFLTVNELSTIAQNKWISFDDLIALIEKNEVKHRALSVAELMEVIENHQKKQENRNIRKERAKKPGKKILDIIRTGADIMDLLFGP